MTLESMKDFLSDLIEIFPGYKTRVLDPDAFVHNWMNAFGTRSEADMKAAAQIWVDKGSKFFPSTEEFQKTLFIVDFRKTQAKQAEYERQCIETPEDRAKLDGVIDDLFGGDCE